MQTQFLWDEKVKPNHELFPITEKEMDFCRIQRGDVFDIWVPDAEEKGGSVIYKVKVTKVEYHFDQTFGDPLGVVQSVFFR